MRVCNYNFAQGKRYIMNNVNSSPSLGSLSSPSSTSSSIAANGSTAGRTGAGTGRTTLVVAMMHDGSASAATVSARPSADVSIGGGATATRPSSKKAAKITLPPPLVNAKLKDIDLEPVLDEEGSPKRDDNFQPMLKAKSVAGVDFSNMNVDFIRALCAQWGLTRYRKLKKKQILELLAQKKDLTEKHASVEEKQKLCLRDMQGATGFSHTPLHRKIINNHKNISGVVHNKCTMGGFRP